MRRRFVSPMEFILNFLLAMNAYLLFPYICGRLGHSESHFRKLLEATDSGVAHGWSEEIKAEHRRQIKNPVVPWRRETRELNLQMIMPDL